MNTSDIVSLDNYQGSNIKKGFVASFSESDKLEIVKAYENADWENSTFQKAFGELFEKGKKANIGEERMFGGKRYVKTPKGWRVKPKGTRKGKKEEGADSTKSSSLPKKEHIEVELERLERVLEAASPTSDKAQEVRNKIAKLYNQLNKIQELKQEADKAAQPQKTAKTIQEFTDNAIESLTNNIALINSVKDISNDKELENATRKYLHDLVEKTFKSDSPEREHFIEESDGDWSYTKVFHQLAATIAAEIQENADSAKSTEAPKSKSDQIRELLKEGKLTKKQIADKVGANYSQVHQLSKKVQSDTKEPSSEGGEKLTLQNFRKEMQAALKKYGDGTVEVLELFDKYMEGEGDYDAEDLNTAYDVLLEEAAESEFDKFLPKKQAKILSPNSKAMRRANRMTPMKEDKKTDNKEQQKESKPSLPDLLKHLQSLGSKQMGRWDVAYNALQQGDKTYVIVSASGKKGVQADAYKLAAQHAPKLPAGLEYKTGALLSPSQDPKVSLQDAIKRDDDAFEYQEAEYYGNVYFEVVPKK